MSTLFLTRAVGRNGSPSSAVACLTKLVWFALVGRALRSTAKVLLSRQEASGNFCQALEGPPPLQLLVTKLETAVGSEGPPGPSSR